MAEESTSGASVTSSSHIGQQLEMMGRNQLDPDETATTSEIDREEPGDCLGGPVVHPREVYNEMARMHNEEARDTEHSSELMSTVHGRSIVDEDGNSVYKQPRVYKIFVTGRVGRR